MSFPQRVCGALKKKKKKKKKRVPKRFQNNFYKYVYSNAIKRMKIMVLKIDNENPKKCHHQKLFTGRRDGQICRRKQKDPIDPP